MWQGDNVNKVGSRGIYLLVQGVRESPSEEVVYWEQRIEKEAVQQRAKGRTLQGEE